MYNCIYVSLSPFREFADRVFGTGEPKKTHPRAVTSGFRESGFQVLCVQGNMPLSIPISEMPEYRNIHTYCPFGISPIGISGLVSTREYTLGYSGPRSAEISYLIHTLNYFGVSDVGIS
jgi:hypothetical protein